jgi:glutamyl-tRNA reductase
VAQQTRISREREAEKAEAIVSEELDAFDRWLGELGLVPAIKEIRLSIEQLRDYELSRHRGWLAGLAPGEQVRVEALTRGLVNKLLHRVLAGLRSNGKIVGDGLYTAELARRLLCGNPEIKADSDQDDDASDDSI